MNSQEAKLHFHISIVILLVYINCEDIMQLFHFWSICYLTVLSLYIFGHTFQKPFLSPRLTALNRQERSHSELNLFIFFKSIKVDQFRQSALAKNILITAITVSIL